jgi:hypothetical protein
MTNTKLLFSINVLFIADISHCKIHFYSKYYGLKQEFGYIFQSTIHRVATILYLSSFFYVIYLSSIHSKRKI